MEPVEKGTSLKKACTPALSASGMEGRVKRKQEDVMKEKGVLQRGVNQE